MYLSRKISPLFGTVHGLTGEFIHASSGLEAELLEDGERCFRGQTVDI